MSARILPIAVLVTALGMALMIAGVRAEALFRPGAWIIGLGLLGLAVGGVLRAVAPEDR